MNTQKKLQRAMQLIDQDLSGELSTTQIARHVHLSPFHFHRLFVAHLGETVAGYVARRRLEAAAKMILARPKQRLIDTALAAGFETHSAFTRAFRQNFGCSPSAFRRRPELARHGLEAHRKWLQPALGVDQSLHPKILNQDDLYFNFRAFRGAQAGRFFNHPSLNNNTLLSDISGPASAEFRGIAGSFPEPPKNLSDDCALGVLGGLFACHKTSQWSANWHVLSAGVWAAFEHRGPFDYLHQTWNLIYRNWVANSGQDLRDEWPYELYLTSPQASKPGIHSATIFIPLESARR